MQPQARPDPLIDSVLLGTYRIDRLGKGGTGSVYAATPIHLQTACAVKGAILYEVLAGRLAYDSPNSMAVMYKLLRCTRPAGWPRRPAGRGA